MRRTTILWLAMAGLATGGCQSVPNNGEGPAIPGQSTSAEPAGRRDRNRITEEDVADLRSRGALDALTLIERARPHWLRVRRTELGDVQPLVLYNDRKLSGPAELRGIPSSTVLSMEYISPPASLGRYGRDAEYGAIIVHGR